jgi:Mor family transcriptional regulator
MKITRRVSKDNKERDEQIVKDYNDGMPMLDLCNKYDKLSQSRIYQIIKEHEGK